MQWTFLHMSTHAKVTLGVFWLTNASFLWWWITVVSRQFAYQMPDERVLMTFILSYVFYCLCMAFVTARSMIARSSQRRVHANAF